MGKSYEGQSTIGDISEALRQAISNASANHGPGFSWTLESVSGTYGIIPFQVSAKIKVD